MQQWNSQRLEKRAAIYNRIYFNNEIKKPIYVRWSRHMYNSDSNINAYCKSVDDYHLIKFNVSYSNVSDEMMRSTLVHEMIHAWQDEHDQHCNDDWKTYQGHGPSFIKKCEELNAKFKFTYPLMRYTEGNKAANLKRQSRDLYFVYKMTTSRLDPGVEYPIGVFVKFMYRNEVKSLMNRGLLVKYYTQAKFSNTTSYPDLNNKFVTETDVPIVYSRLKKCTSDDFVNYIIDECGLYHVVTDEDFNYNDGIEVEI